MGLLGDIVSTLLAPAYGLLIKPQRDAAKAQKQALKDQENAQREALAQSAAQRRQADMRFAAANRKAPDLASILSGEQGAARGGTLLTGPSGVDRERLKLGKSSLLGG